MAPVGLLLSLLCCLSLLTDHSGSGAPAPPAPAPGLVFLSGRAADSVLRRQRRHNTGVFEEFMQGDLERECAEEKCSLEEAREVFEDDQKTMDFWAAYIDGDQCKSHPCQNQGVCKDNLGSFTCTCPPHFTGRNCEIATAKRCDVNNGDCVHFCEPVGASGAKCSCADGYKLSEEGLHCLPQVDYPCGRDTLTVISDMLTRLLGPNGTTGAPNSTTTNITAADITTTSSTTATTTNTTSSSISSSSSASPVTASAVPPSVTPAASAGPPSVTLAPRSRRSPAEVLMVMDQQLTKRIVGGEDVSPGEIPWQVGLIARPGGQLFCGGSILSEVWIITAAHCLVEGSQSFYVRAGEHNLQAREGSEQNLEVRDEYLHPLYNASVSLYNHDIALLRLRSPVRFSATASPICLGPKAFTEALVKEQSPGTVSGWGRLLFLGATASTLQKVALPYVERAECKLSSASRITRYMFCAGYVDQAKDSCQGDSGGPHANRYHDTWFLTGIVSWGEECAKEGKFGVYTRLSHYYRWIRKVMRSRPRTALGEPDEPDEPDP